MDYQMTQLIFLCSHDMMVSVQISVVHQMALLFYLQNLLS